MFFSNRCPNCGATVHRKAHYCSKCQMPTGQGYALCAACKRPVGLESSFCWSCGHPQKPEDRHKVFGDRWWRETGDFAQRVEFEDLHGLLTKGLLIQEGTQAFLLKNGRLLKFLGPGYHTLAGMTESLLTFLDPPPRSAILFDVAEFEVPVALNELFTKEGQKVEADLRFMIRIDDQNPIGFLHNLFKDRRNLTASDIASIIAPEIEAGLKPWLTGFTLEDLFKNQHLRSEIERQAQTAIESTLRSLGLLLLRARFIDFAGPAWDRRMDQEREIDDTDHEQQYHQRLRQIASRERLDQIRSETELVEAEEVAAQGLSLSRIDREEARTKLLELYRRNRELTETDHQNELLLKQREGEWERSWKDFDNRLEQREKEFQQNLSEEARTHDEKVRRAKQAQALLEDTLRVEREDEEAKLRMRGQASIESLLTTLSGPEAEQLQRHLDRQAQENLSTEQLFIIAAKESPLVASALVEKFKSESGLRDELLQEIRNTLAEQRTSGEKNLDRLERLAKEMFTQMANAVPHTVMMPPEERKYITIRQEKE